MLNIVGSHTLNQLSLLQISGICPHCNTGTRFTLVTGAMPQLRATNPKELIAGYTCDLCFRAVPVLWTIQSFDNQHAPIVKDPQMILRVREEFEFAHVPDEVAKEISEGLDCLSVNAYNGFAAMCRRAVQSMCTSLGAAGSTKVQNQIKEMATIAGLNDETQNIAIEVMMAGHDGSHPHLPTVNAERASVLLSLVRDLAYQLFTRPGKIKESATLRKAAIEGQK